MYRFLKIGLLFSIMSIFLLGFGFAISDNNFDLSIKSITISPSSPDAGENVTVKCVVQNLSSEDVEFDNLELTFYIDDGEDIDDYDVTESNVSFTSSGDSEKYEYEFETNPDVDGNVKFSCKITDYELDNDYDNYDDLNTNNDDAFLTVNFKSMWDQDGIDLGIYDIDVDDDSPQRGQEIDIYCTYANFGDNDAPTEDGDATLYWLVDNDTVKQTKLGDIDSGDKDEKTYTYTIPSNYPDDEMEIGCKVNWDPEDNDDEDDVSHNDKKYMTIEVNGTYFDSYNYTNNTNYNPVTTTTSYPNLIISSLSIVNQPALIDESNIISCVVQNYSQAKTTGSYSVNLYVDDSKIGTWTTTNILNAQGYDSFDKPYVFMMPGEHKIKCNVSTTGVETEFSDNEKIQTITIADPKPIIPNTNSFGSDGSTNSADNKDTVDVTSNSNEPITKSFDYKWIVIIVLGAIIILYLIYKIVRH